MHKIRDGKMQANLAKQVHAHPMSASFKSLLNLGTKEVCQQITNLGTKRYIHRLELELKMFLSHQFGNNMSHSWMGIQNKTVRNVQLCGSRKYPYPPPTDGQWKFLGGGGLKGRNFQGVWGVGNVKNFLEAQTSQNRATQTYGKYFDLQCPKTLK